MDFLINFGIAIIVIGLVLALFIWAINRIVPEPFKNIGITILVLIAGLIILGMAFGHVGGGFHFVHIG